MDYVSDKVTMLVGEASSRVNDTRRKWRQRRQQQATGPDDQPEAGRAQGQQQRLQTRPDDPPTRHARVHWARVRDGHWERASDHRPDLYRSPLAAGTPFGGDSLPSDGWSNRQAPPPPPPIGFKTELLTAGQAGQWSTPIGGQQQSEQRQATAQAGDTAPGQSRQQPEGGDLGASDESLYRGDAWARLWFQRVMILSLLRLVLFVRKVYEDYQATKLYSLTGQSGHLLIAAATLLLPTLVFTTYRVSRYLQIALPPLRAIKGARQPPYPETGKTSAAETSGPRRRLSRDQFGSSEAEAQLTRALMSSPDQSVGGRSPTPTAAPAPAADPDNEGLVTARQTPTNLDEFHDSESQQGATEPGLGAVASGQSLPSEPARPTRASELQEGASPKLESVNVDRLLGEAADRETTRIVTGASEQLLHGALFIFWQLKRQVDVLGYLVERACLWRRPAELEKAELGRLRTGSDGLEWFQDFYAAFLAILAQVYTLGLHWAGEPGDPRGLSAAQLGTASSGLPPDSGSAPGSGGDLSISQSARAISNLLGSQALSGNALGGKDVLIMSELIVSTAVVVSLLIAVRRRDDGPLTLGLSMLGWGSMFAARIIIVALAFVHLGWHLMLSLVALHVLLITGWVYSIAIASHNDRPSERLDEAHWDEETAIEIADPKDLELEPVEGNRVGEQQDKTKESDDKQRQTASESSQDLGGAGNQVATKSDAPTPRRVEDACQTSNWSVMEHLVLIAQILSLFAIPSLFYWPIMFNLKLHFRPFKYLVLILIENFLLIPAIWLSISQAAATPGQLYLLGTVGGLSILGFIFISLYIACKPSLTEYFARADELFNEAEKSGIYYEFCSRVFKMPDLSKHTFRRLMNQTEELVEEEVVVEEERETR